MSVINILSPHVADLIAAGEVVERPASVVKELLENSFDAGARHVVCEIRDGGATYIRVTDDGCGMAPEDAGIAFVRHATSKLSDESGLEHISTMGFRGEALAAISSVSHMELLTRQKGAEEGTRVLLDAGEIEEMIPCGCPEGTTMICRNLFFNTPARLKFLKSDRSEASACITAALRCALGRPDVSVRFVRDGKEEFFSPGDGKLDSCLYALLGREEAASMLSCSSASDGLSLSGFVSSPAEGRGNRAHQFFFVNGRFIKSTLLQSAVEQAYRNTLLVGRYPSCVLYLTLSFSSVDVNVHPAKTEIRFGSEKRIFDFVYQAVRLALASEDRLNTNSDNLPLTGKGDRVAVDEVFSRKESGGIALNGTQTHAPSIPSEQINNSVIHNSEQHSESTTPSAAEPSQLRITNYELTPTPYPLHPTPSSSPTPYSLTPNSSSTSPLASPSTPYSLTPTPSSTPVPCPLSPDPSSPVPDHRILGEAFKTYIIVESRGELILIDKHAAHERMIFDRLKAAGRSVSSQMLLMPAIVRLSLEDMELLERNAALLSDLGFELEPYGEKEIIVRGVPAEMPASDVSSSIEEICEKLRSSKTPDPSSVHDEILHTVACKAAIKAGWDTQRPELEKIVSAVLSGAVLYCPHGRPVSSVLTRKDLDKLFKRIV
ncbi:MAG: DNA mismatch repair endonuclease MutL [Oscillospiraceae bacterium]|nr:DNA mismatch repair endonuclease MutL [Oscillospiraceae bacterium]